MKSCAFISRHEPTPEQHALAARAGYELKCVGDADAFNSFELEQKVVGFTPPPEGADFPVTPYLLYDAVCVVHPAAAMHLLPLVKRVLVFRNENRAPVGEKPQFLATELHQFGILPGGENIVVVTK